MAGRPVVLASEASCRDHAGLGALADDHSTIIQPFLSTMANGCYGGHRGRDCRHRDAGGADPEEPNKARGTRMNRSAPSQHPNADAQTPDPSTADDPGQDGNLDDVVAALRGILAAGQGTPSERALAERLNVKRHRLRRALDQLRAAGELAPARAGRPRSTTPRRGDDLARDTNPVEIIELRMVLE